MLWITNPFRIILHLGLPGQTWPTEYPTSSNGTAHLSSLTQLEIVAQCLNISGLQEFRSVGT